MYGLCLAICLRKPDALCQDLTGADRIWAARYNPGDVLRYSRSSQETGIGKGEYARVTRIDAPNDHALAVDVGDLQPGDLGAAHAGAIENHQQRTLEQAAAGVDQTCDFFPAEDVGQLPRSLGIGQVLAEPMTMKRAHEEESKCGHVVLNGSRAEFSFPEQIGLVAAQMIRTELVRR